MNENIRLRSGASSPARKVSDELQIPSFSCGLTEDEVTRSREKFGENTLTPKKRAGFLRQFLANLNDPIIKILIGALVLNSALTFTNINWAENIGIALTVIISTLVSTISEHSSGSAFEKLYSKLDDGHFRLLRGGRDVTCRTSEIVKYDIVYLSPGDTVPADGIIISGSVACDESSLTGESRKVTKTRDPSAMEAMRKGANQALSPGNTCAVFRGSHVTSGSATMLVTAVGEATVYGKVAAELAVEDSESPLKARLSRLAKTISKIGYASAAVIAAVHLVDAFWIESGMSVTVMRERLGDLHLVFTELVSALKIAISIVVVAVPEGLPMMITVVLSSNMKKMMKSGVLVRRLVGIETAGGIDMLFTDKTGTITTGKLSVVRVVTSFGEAKTISALPDAIKRALSEAASACSSVANSTERAINAFTGAKKLKRSDSIRRIPFDSSRKFSAAVLGDTLYVQGAAEYILPSCVSHLTSDGRAVPMSAEVRDSIRESIESYSRKSCRVLCVAKGAPSELENLSRGFSGDKTPLTFIAVYVLRDEIRPEAVSAVEECHRAGIQVVMLTGDNCDTAQSIAMECGILEGRCEVFNGAKKHESGIPTVIDGGTLAMLTDDELSALLPDVRVISRVTPSDKSRLVRLAKAAGHITGMTGDGVNDAPALRVSDVGFAMGSGTDVAREAGDIVITDDNFASVTRAVLFGRTIFDSIRKFITFQLTMNLAAVGVSVIGTMFGIESPVTVIQMLWVNIIMDTLGSLAFAGEPALPEIMHRPPVGRGEHILNRRMVWEILTCGAYAISASVYFLVSPRMRHFFGGGGVYHLTSFFAMLIFMGIGIAMCARTPRLNLFANLRKNRAFLVIMPAVCAIQLLIVYFGGEVFRCVPITGGDIFYCALFSLTFPLFDTVRKCVVRIIGKRRKV